jgi:hypothetical protein
MPRGGKREGSGPKSNWKNGKTKTIRVPISLADDILNIARRLDEQQPVEFSGFAQVIDFSSMHISVIEEKRFVFLEDLMNLGYEIKPLELADIVRQQALKR